MRAKWTLAAASFFLSGMAGLVYEVAWIRAATPVFGSTVHALSSVLAVFFLGLAIGSAFFGRLTLRLRHPLRVAALLQVVAAVFAVASPWVFVFGGSLYGSAVRSGSSDGALFFTRLAAVAFVVLPPTIAMGGTLPLFCRHFIERREHVGVTFGFLYALNTLGAAAGCFLAGLIWIPALGVRTSLALAAGLDVIAALAIAVPFWHAKVDPVEAREPATSGSRVVLLILFLGGFGAIGMEVLWARFLALVTERTVLGATLALGSTLLGIVLGSLFAGFIADRTKRPALVLGGLLAAHALGATAVLLLPVETWRSIGGETSATLALLLPLATLSGATLPVAVRLSVSSPSEAGHGAGRLTAVNTIGAILGSILVGFFLLPVFGIESSARVVTGTLVAGAALAWIGLERRTIPVLITAGLWFALPWLSTTRVPQDFLYDAASGTRLVAHAEGLEGNLAVVEKGGVLRLEIDRWWQGQDERNHQIMAAHVPMALHPSAKSVLVVGVGVGQTAKRFLDYNVERVDCVDIEPKVYDLIEEHFDSAWMTDERVRCLRAGGRAWVAYSPESYDLISLELGQTFRPGVETFYTHDFYALARERLNPGGVVAQFVPLPFLTKETFRSIVATFLEAFPESVLWYNTAELLLVGKRDGELRFEEGAFASRSDLEWSPWGGPKHWLSRPEAFAAGFLARGTELASLARGARVYTDDRPALGRATRGVDPHATGELASLALIQEHLSPAAAILAPGSRLDVAEVERLRSLNVGDLEAAAWLRQVELERGKANPSSNMITDRLQRACSANPENLLANRWTADMHVLAGRLQEARKAYEYTLTIAPTDALTHRGLGTVLHRAGELAPAIEHYTAALSERPDDAETHNNLGAALGASGDPQAALRHFEKAVNIDPKNADARQNRDKLRAALGL